MEQDGHTEAQPSGGEAQDASIARLRAEASEVHEASRRARLLHEVAEIEEQLGDLVAASRDNLAAFNADESFVEPLEALLRLTERRKSLANGGKLLEALVRAAKTPDERVRALVLRAAQLADEQNDWEGARGALREATELEASLAELATAWLSLELVAGKLADPTLRAEALAARAEHTHHATWRGLLLVDVARLAAEAGDVEHALSTCERAIETEGGAAFAAAVLLESIARAEPGESGSDEAARRRRLLVAALEAQVRMVDGARTDAERAKSLGVPSWLRGDGVLLDLWLRLAVERERADQPEAALEILDAVLANAGTQADDVAALTVLRARLQVGDVVGDPNGVALAQAEIGKGRAAVLSAGLGIRVAAAALQRGDEAAARTALGEVVGAESPSLLAEAMQRRLLENDAGALLDYLEGLISRLDTPAGKARHALYAAFVAALRVGDGERAGKLLEAAPLDAALRARVERALAHVAGDTAALERSTQAVLAQLPDDEQHGAERLGLLVELYRLGRRRDDEAASAKAIEGLRADPAGLGVARLLEAFLPSGAAATRSRALDELAREGLGGGSSDGVRATFAMLSVLEKLEHARSETGTPAEIDAVLRAVQAILVDLPSDLFAQTLRLELLAKNASADLAEHTLEAARQLDDAEAAASLAVQAGLRLHARGELAQARAAFDEAERLLDTAGRDLSPVAELSAWAGRLVPASAEGARSRAVATTSNDLADPSAVALETLGAVAAEGALGEAGPEPELVALAEQSLEALSGANDNDLRLAGALARLAWVDGDDDPSTERAVHAALADLEAVSTDARRAVSAERVRRADSAEVPEGRRVELARAWFEAGGGFPAALQWLHAARTQRGAAEGAEALEAAAFEERRALQAAANATDDPALQESLRIEAALVLPQGLLAARMPLLALDAKTARLANLELAPPGCDPRRRVTVLSEVGDALGEASELDACSLAGWSALAGGDAQLALDLFGYVVQSRADDLAAWEGQRTAAKALQHHEALGQAAEALGQRVADATRSAELWEEAGNAWIAVGAGYETRGEEALRKSFARAPERHSAFDTLFRRLRERKAHEDLLALTAERLEQVHPDHDDKARDEAAKLHWERARALRELGRIDEAMQALTTVRELDASHIGALALLGEIHIRQGNFQAAADSLSQLANEEAAPARNRATAGVTAVDLYENKLDQWDRALQVLEDLHRAGLSTPPIRERLARAAIKTSAWTSATAILEELMHERDTPQTRAEAARVALRIHRDQLAAPSAAEAALKKLLEERPADGEGIDLLLATSFSADTTQRLLRASRAALHAALSATDAQPEVDDLLRLASLAQRLDQPVLQQACVSSAAALGNAGARDTLAKLAARKPRSPRVALDAGRVARVRAPGDTGPLGDLFRLLGPTIAEALGPNLAALGVTKKDRVDPRAGLALRNEVSAWAGALGLPELDLYVGGNQPNLVRGIPGDTPALVVGAQVNAPLSPLLRGEVARELYALGTGTTVLRTRDDLTVAAIVVAACRLAKVDIAAPAYAVLAEVERAIGKAIPRKVKNALPDPCRAVVATNADTLAWVKHVLQTHARVALLASGELSGVLTHSLAITSTGTEAAGDPRTTDLVRFGLSAEFEELRRGLGLEGDA